MTQIEKRVGHDWTVVFRDIENNGLIFATLYGVTTAEQAAQQAHADCGMPPDCDILMILREDVAEEVLRKLEE